MVKVVVGRNPMNIQGAFPDLQKQFPNVEFVYCPKEEDLLEVITDADVFVGWPSRKVFLAAGKLRWVQVPGTGVDSVLAIPELKSGDVLLTNIRGAHGVAISESVFGMILAFTRGIKQSVLNQERRVWAQLELRKQLVELTGSTMGIIGLGSIGRAVARRADAFDMRVLAIDMFPNSKPDYVDELWGLERLGDLLGQSDYVVVTVPGTAQTKSMIGAEEIARMKRTAMLIGVSRGGVIDEAALVEALKEKRLAYAALDVFEREPLPAESELWGMDNVLVTAHIAGGTQFEGKYTIDILRENLGRFLKGEFPLRNQVDKQLGF